MFFPPSSHGSQVRQMTHHQLQTELREVERKIEEVISLMREDWIDSKLETARKRRDKHDRDMSTAYILERK